MVTVKVNKSLLGGVWGGRLLLSPSSIAMTVKVNDDPLLGGVWGGLNKIASLAQLDRNDGNYL